MPAATSHRSEGASWVKSFGVTTYGLNTTPWWSSLLECEQPSDGRWKPSTCGCTGGMNSLEAKRRSAQNRQTSRFNGQKNRLGNSSANGSNPTSTLPLRACGRKCAGSRIGIRSSLEERNPKAAVYSPATDGTGPGGKTNFRSCPTGSGHRCLNRVGG